MYPIIEIFGKEIGTYGICTLVGIFVCAFLSCYLVKKKGLFYEDMIITIVYILIGMFIGGHILYGITNIPHIITLFQNAEKYTWWNFLKLLVVGYFGGMVFYGGLLGGIAALAIVCKRGKNLPANVVFDIYAIDIPLFHAFGRVGCFLGGCCYGVESKFGFTVHNNQLNPAINDVNRFPVQLVEAACNLIIFFIIFTLYRKGKFQNRLLIVYFYIYPVVRFTLEFFRGDEIRGFLFGLSTSQIISILLFVFAVIFTIVDLNKKRKNGGEPAEEAKPAEEPQMV